MTRVSLVALLFLMTAVCVHAENSAKDISEVREKLIVITRKIMQLEREIIDATMSNSLLVNQEKNALSTIFDQKRIGMTLQNLRHVQGSSPLFMAITSRSVDDLVKIIMLLQALEPQINSKYNNALAQLKEISLNRSKIKSSTQDYEQKRELMRQLENEQAELLTQKYHLFFKASHNPNLEKFARQHNKIESSNDHAQNFDDLVHQLQTLFSSDTSKSTYKLSLLSPVNGVLSANNSELSTTQQDLSLNFSAHPNAQVISPLSARVVFTGFIPTFGQVVILKQDDFFCVMTGLATVHCFLGDTLLSGEPIGRMPSGDRSVQTFKLRIELHKGGQHLDPRPYLS